MPASSMQIYHICQSSGSNSVQKHMQNTNLYFDHIAIQTEIPQKLTKLTIDKLTRYICYI